MIFSPPVRGLPQRLIIKCLILVDLLFKGNIFSGIIAIFIKQQQGKQPRHSPVSVPEGMNAEEVQNDAGDQQELIDIGVITGVHIGEFQLFHGLCCLISRCGAEAHFPVSVGVHFQNDIIVCFVLPAILIAGNGHHHFMQPQNITLPKVHVSVIGMDCIQCVPISRDLGFVVV